MGYCYRTEKETAAKIMLRYREEVVRGQLQHSKTQGWEGEGMFCRRQGGGLHWRWAEPQLPGDTQAEMLVRQMEMDAWNPRREGRPEGVIPEHHPQE